MEPDTKIFLPLDFDQVVQLVRQLSSEEKHQLLEYLESWESGEPTLTHFASEQALAEDWLSPEEDEAWANL